MAIIIFFTKDLITCSTVDKHLTGNMVFEYDITRKSILSTFATLLGGCIYLYGLFTGVMGPESLMWLAIAAYFIYVLNAAQFLLKLRAARLEMTLEVQHA